MCRVDSFIKKIMILYRPDDTTAQGQVSVKSELVNLRARLCAHSGKHLLNVGGSLDQAVKKKHLYKQTLHPTDRATTLKEATEGFFCQA